VRVSSVPHPGCGSSPSSSSPWSTAPGSRACVFPESCVWSSSVESRRRCATRSSSPSRSTTRSPARSSRTLGARQRTRRCAPRQHDHRLAGFSISYDGSRTRPPGGLPRGRATASPTATVRRHARSVGLDAGYADVSFTERSPGRPRSSSTANTSPPGQADVRRHPDRLRHHSGRKYNRLRAIDDLEAIATSTTTRVPLRHFTETETSTSTRWRRSSIPLALEICRPFAGEEQLGVALRRRGRVDRPSSSTCWPSSSTPSTEAYSNWSGYLHQGRTEEASRRMRRRENAGATATSTTVWGSVPSLADTGAIAQLKKRCPRSRSWPTPGSTSRVFRQLGDEKKASEEYQAALEIDPTTSQPDQTGATVSLRGAARQGRTEAETSPRLPGPPPRSSRAHGRANFHSCTVRWAL